MFTDDSILLRDYFFPRITLKNSTDLDKLYKHLQSIHRLPIHITNFKENKERKEVRIQSGYAPQKILKKVYTLKKSSTSFLIDHLKCTLNIYDYSENSNQKFIDNIIGTIQYVASLSKIIISQLDINLYLLNDKKKVDISMKQLGKEEINSGSCLRGDTTVITIYRKEEVMKVVIHELIHAFQYDDFVDTPQIIKHYQKKYNISSQEINTNEAYTEIWANIINCYLISQKVKRSQYNLFLVLIALEKVFVEFQTNKVIFLTNLQKQKIDINKDTNVLSYFIIRNELYLRLNAFLKFCKTKNKDYIKLTQKEKWFEFIKKNKLVKGNNKRFNKIKKTDFLFTTKRMTLKEIHS